METYNDSNLSYMTPVGSYTNILSHIPLKNLELDDDDDDVEEYLKTLDKNIERLTLSNRTIINITDIFSFPNLIKLDISRTKTKFIPYIPDTIEIFICRNNFLIECPRLNKCLKVLDLGNNLIKDMPEFTPNLEYVDVDYNGLKLFRNFNHGLLYLSARNNHLTRLPFLPDTLKVLQIDNNPDLKIIPILPDSLDICSMIFTEFFNIYNNNIYNNIHSFNLADAYETVNYNMESIKNYIKMINENIMKNRSWFRRYIWYIREKVIKIKFSPDKLKNYLETYKSKQNFTSDTAEWFDEMFDNWNSDSDQIFDKQYNIKYTRNNDQMYASLNNFYTESPYLLNISHNIIVGDFDNDEYYDYSDYEQYEYENTEYENSEHDSYFDSDLDIF
jgi:hypothetical protein